MNKLFKLIYCTLIVFIIINIFSFQNVFAARAGQQTQFTDGGSTSGGSLNSATSQMVGSLNQIDGDSISKTEATIAKTIITASEVLLMGWFTIKLTACRNIFLFSYSYRCKSCCKNKND